MAAAADPRKANILLGGEDDMEEDEDVFADEPVTSTSGGVDGATTMTTTTTTNNNMPMYQVQRELISTIIQPSPFPHHTSGPTSSRFRTSLQRIQSDPEGDVEAWQALLTEVGYCYRQVLPKIHVVDAEIQLQLDWMESCYGQLLRYFPYSASNYCQVAEMLMAQSAQLGEEHGPLMDYGLDHARQQTCQAKLERIFELTLGIQMDGSPVAAPPVTTDDENNNNNNSTEDNDNDEQASHTPEALLGGMCTASVELWMLYIQTRARQARRTQDDSLIKQWTTKAFELAIEHAGFGFNNHIVWKAYLQWAKTSSTSSSATTAPTPLDPQQLQTLRNIYQRLVCHPMTGLDQLWQEYEAFERNQSEALAAALISEFTLKYQHARTVYLERNRVFSVQDLQTNKLATPPNDDDLAEDYPSLQLWKTRTSYERTNPERLDPADLAIRIRTAYKEMASVWTKHPEVWHMWSAWEETAAGASGTTVSGGGAGGGVERAIAVLQKGQEHIPDCTLLAYAHAQLVELHYSGGSSKHKKPSECLKVMKAFLDRSPNTLGFTLYQQMVRRYQGIEAARAVFRKARRVLKSSDAAGSSVQNKNNAGESSEQQQEEETKDDGDTPTNEDTGKRWLVTNRLNPQVGNNSGSQQQQSGAGGEQPPPTSSSTANMEDGDDEDGNNKVQAGPITWHLYASHAAIEHRLNRLPEVAARVYELGLRKHASFLTKPPYVLRFAQLLLELQDNVNLRALLTRALAACPQKTPAVAALWDMAVQFESLVSIGDPTNLQAVVKIERKRRAALLGPDIEDVATGSRVGVGDSVTIGAQKSTVSEQLVRQDGYDANSAIINGMTRTVDVLDIMGLWGNGMSSSQYLTSNRVDNDLDEIPGGKSDLSYQKRLQYSRLMASGASLDAAGGGGAGGMMGGVGGDPSSRALMSARERLQTNAPASQNTAITMAIQNSPEWLRELLLLLPASKSRVPVLSKPPPHLTEMALATMRQNELPAERPQDDNGTLTGNKHKLGTTGGGGGGGGGDSSDEEGGPVSGGGYGTQFRARQRARQMATQSNGMKTEH